MTSVFFGVPAYGGQSPKWWSRIVAIAANLHSYDITFDGVLVSASMLVDHNRNFIAERFLEFENAEWLFWIDSDTIPPRGTIHRLLGTGKSLVGGLYYAKGDPHEPIAYERLPDGKYRSIRNFVPGEILPADAAGMGCILMHRSVLEDIKKTHVPLQRLTGGIILVPKDDIQGEIKDKKNKTDMTVVNGVYRDRVWEPNGEYKYPFFGSEYGRTEDMWFFEKAKKAGHNLWIDTSVECKHIGPKEFTGHQYRKEIWLNRFERNFPHEMIDYIAKDE